MGISYVIKKKKKQCGTGIRQTYIDERNRTECPEIDSYQYSQLIFKKGANTIQWGGGVSSTNGAETTESHMQNNEVGPLSHTIHQKSRWIRNLNIKVNIVKVLRKQE